MDNPTASIVKEYINQNPLLQNYLEQGLINYSALARQLLPQVQQKNPKARIESIIIAIQRNIPKKSININNQIQQILKTTELTITSNINQLVFEKTKDNQHQLLKFTQHRTDSSLSILTENRDQISLFVSEHLTTKTTLPKPKQTYSSLAVLGLYETNISKKSNSKTIPGYLSHLTILFATHNINIIELITCHSQILIFIQQKQATIAYDLIQNHISQI